MAEWSEWIGRTETREDILTPALIRRFCATLDSGIPADMPPQGIHWCLGTPETASAKLGPDGHPQRDLQGFLPPISLPRRMWASGKLHFHQPLVVGTSVTRRSTIYEIEEKQGASGPLCFVHLDHEIIANGACCITERQTLVYRGESGRMAVDKGGAFNPAEWQWRRDITPDEALLFRYSALTFNAHRIHYDAPYAHNVEHYPGLIVHGPLLATLLLDLAARHVGGDRLSGFSFRALSPAIAGSPLHLVGRETDSGMEFGAFAGNGRQVMSADAKL